MKIEVGRKLDSFLITGGVRGGKTDFINRQMNEYLEAAAEAEWENELDALGANNSAEKYIEMLQKAPEFSSSKQALTEHIQQIMSA